MFAAKETLSNPILREKASQGMRMKGIDHLKCCIKTLLKKVMLKRRIREKCLWWHGFDQVIYASFF